MPFRVSIDSRRFLLVSNDFRRTVGKDVKIFFLKNV